MRRLLLCLSLSPMCTAACMDTHTASLGDPLPVRAASIADAGSTRSASDSATEPDLDVTQPRLDASQDWHDVDAHAPDVDPLGDSAEAGSTSVGGSADSAVAHPAIDGGHAQISGDASPSDASHTSKDDDDDDSPRDSGRPINPICITEPWHCD